MLTKSVLGVAIATALSFSVSAQEQSIEHITVTANKFEQSVNDVLASVAVIERHDIEQSNVRDLPSLLATQAGFQINSNGGFGQNSGVSLRGSGSRHTLILIDGVRVGSATLGTKSISNIPLNSIERVEIVKGSRAAVYGSDALAGVINIITRDTQQTTIDVTFGSDAYQDYQLTSGASFGAVDLAVNAGFEKTDGFDVMQGIAPDDDDYENKNIGFNLGYDDTEFGKMSLLGQYSEGNAQYDSAYSPVDSTVENNDFSNYQLALGWDKTFNNHSHSVQVSISSDDSDNERAEYTGGSVIDSYNTKRTQLDYHGNYSASDSLTISGGLNWYEDKIETNGGSYLEDSKDVKAAFVGGYFDDDSVIANLAVRIDDDEAFGNETTYTAGVGYHLSEFATFRLSQSTGFKAPTFNDLYYPSSGNPDLLPETSDNQELGLVLNVNDIDLEVSLFRSDIENKIAWAPNASGAWQPMNINQARHEGAEFSFAQTLWGFKHAFNFTYLTAKDTETGQTLPFVAKQTVNWSLTKQFGALDAGIDMQYRGDRQGSYTQLTSYTLWNLVANYALTEQLSLSMRVENLFDKQYDAVDAYGNDLDGDYVNDEFYYYNTADRRFFVGARYQF